MLFNKLIYINKANVCKTFLFTLWYHKYKCFLKKKLTNSIITDSWVTKKNDTLHKRKFNNEEEKREKESFQGNWTVLVCHQPNDWLKN